MKIELKLTSDEISYLSDRLAPIAKSDLKFFHSLDRSLKLTVSICIDMADKFAAKFKSLSRKASLFNEKKKYSVTLRYHEAIALSQYLSVTDRKSVESPYQSNIRIKTIATLDQKTA